MRGEYPILDWHLNKDVPDAMEHLVNARVAEFLTTYSPDPVYRQLDICVPEWKVWGPSPDGVGWTLMENDYLYHPNIGMQTPSASAWLRGEKIVVYNYGLLCIIQPDDSFTVGRII